MSREQRHADRRNPASGVLDVGPKPPPASMSGGRGPRPDEIFHQLALAGHHVVGGKVRCQSPDHKDRTPSAQVYEDEKGGHIHCFGCGRHWDLVDFLTEIRGMKMRDALEHAGRERDPTAPRRRRTTRPPTPVKACNVDPLPLSVVRVHDRLAARLDHVPEALTGRGLALADCRALHVAEANGNATFPIWGPDGAVLRLKVRRAHPTERGMRYFYADPGTGTPAWCSPTVATSPTILVIEGELNGAVCWRARPELGVIGVAGTSGCLPLEALAGRTVVVYADGDQVGHRARERWATAAHLAGAASVLTLDPWPDGDACDVAGAHGLVELERRLS